MRKILVLLLFIVGVGIFLLAKNQIPKSTSNEITSWKTYSNSRYGFSFQYDDKTVELKEGDSSLGFILQLFSKKLDFNRNWKDPSKPYKLAADDENFLFLEVENKKAAAGLFPKGCVGFDKTKKALISSNEGLYQEITSIQGGGPGYSKFICLEKGNFDYMFLTQYAADSPLETKNATIESFNQILSTFKFTQ